jgi:antitoxin (DNA-binding transcriptional repressor) of toxin-antitoxin stability system
MITVGAFEAKTHLSSLLDKVEAGEDVLITRHGQAVAQRGAQVTQPTDYGNIGSPVTVGRPQYDLR